MQARTRIISGMAGPPVALARGRKRGGPHAGGARGNDRLRRGFAPCRRRCAVPSACRRGRRRRRGHLAGVAGGIGRDKCARYRLANPADTAHSASAGTNASSPVMVSKRSAPTTTSAASGSRSVTMAFDPVRSCVPACRRCPAESGERRALLSTHQACPLMDATTAKNSDAKPISRYQVPLRR